MSNWINRTDLIELIQRIPSEVKPDADDYARVVRCKDCKHYKDGECTNTFWGTAEGDYCSEGKRKEERRMKEFIYRIEDNELAVSKVFIGWIRKEGHELIRCKDCKAYLPETETLASYCPILKIYGLPEDAYCYKAQRRKDE